MHDNVYTLIKNVFFSNSIFNIVHANSNVLLYELTFLIRHSETLPDNVSRERVQIRQ